MIFIVCLILHFNLLLKIFYHNLFYMSIFFLEIFSTREVRGLRLKAPYFLPRIRPAMRTIITTVAAARA